MTGEQLILVGIVLSALSGLPGLLLSRQTWVGHWLANALLLVGCGYGLAGLHAFVTGVPSVPIRLPSPLGAAELVMGLDALSAFFLAPILVLSALGSIYGLDYWKQRDHPSDGRKLRVCYGLLTASLCLLVMARDWVLFLLAWEVMAVANFLLVVTEDQESEVRAAGWMYLAASHVAALCLFAALPILAAQVGTYEFRELSTVAPGPANTIFLLTFAAFGLKAGVVPLHFWLPGAHANAPSHVSALMSGVVLKVGIYGLLRICALMPNGPAWWGGLTLALGAVSGVLGVAWALGQKDLKRVLAYSTIENIGIILMGIGLALIGRSAGRADWVLLGLVGALFHVWNHACFKGLLFFAAGSVIHATHTRELDRMGGLARRLPWTATVFLVGAVAICGLPPLNGFVSEWLIYVGLFRTLGIGGGAAIPGAAFAVPALAMIGALAVACFVRAFGTIFLGSPRTDLGRPAHESGVFMRLPMVALACACLFLGLAPTRVAPALEAAAGAWNMPAMVPLNEVARLDWIDAMGVFLPGLALAIAVAAWIAMRRRPAAADATWGCGYAVPTPRMQYTATSLSELLVGWFAWALRPTVRPPTVTGCMPEAARFHSDISDAVLTRVVSPGVAGLERMFAWSRILQQGSAQAYILYIVVMLVFLLLWV